MKIKVISPGLLSSIQDGGRKGMMAFGFASGGAMDEKSFNIANILVGNSKNDPCIEMTMVGGVFSFDGDCVVAIAGANMSPKLNGEDAPMNAAIQISSGDVLAFSASTDGMRTYLSIFGGFDLEPVFGSFSTNLKVKLGGFHGRKLQANDEIPLKSESSISQIGRREYKNALSFSKEKTVRVLLGPQDDAFSQNGIQTFLTTPYIVTEKSDRMGIRLDGEKIESKAGVDIISDGIAFGSVQIPASGTPIIMMADRQTTGGYAKIATVLSADLPLLAQARPNDEIRFEKVSEKEAEKIYKRYKKEIELFEYEMMFKR